MCDTCLADDVARTEKSNAAHAMLVQAKQIDTAVVLKTDIFTAKTPAAVELQAAILADDAIPEENKDYAYAKATFDRFMHFKQVVFNQRAELLAAENEMRMWQVNAQEAAGKVHGEAKAEFRALDNNYQPTMPAAPKPKPGKSPASYKRDELNDASKKYNVPKDAVRMTMISQNMNAENAAKFLAGLMANKGLTTN